MSLSRMLSSKLLTFISVLVFFTLVRNVNSMSFDSESVHFIEFRTVIGGQAEHSYVFFGEQKKNGSSVSHDRGYGLYNRGDTTLLDVILNRPMKGIVHNEKSTEVSKYKKFYVTELQYRRAKIYAEEFSESVASVHAPLPYRAWTNNCNHFVVGLAEKIGLKLNPPRGIWDKINLERNKLMPWVFMDTLIENYSSYEPLKVGYEELRLKYEQRAARIKNQRQRDGKWRKWLKNYNEALSQRAFMRSVIPRNSVKFEIPNFNTNAFDFTDFDTAPIKPDSISEKPSPVLEHVELPDIEAPML